jgi:hypothetical protein
MDPLLDHQEESGCRGTNHNVAFVPFNSLDGYRGDQAGFGQDLVRLIHGVTPDERVRVCVKQAATIFWFLIADPYGEPLGIFR